MAEAVADCRAAHRRRATARAVAATSKGSLIISRLVLFLATAVEPVSQIKIIVAVFALSVCVCVRFIFVA